MPEDSGRGITQNFVGNIRNIVELQRCVRFTVNQQAKLVTDFLIKVTSNSALVQYHESLAT